MLMEAHLLILADSNNVHCISGFQVFSGIIYIRHIITVGLIKIMKHPRISKFVLFHLLQLIGKFSCLCIRIERLLKFTQLKFKSPPVALHKACKSNDNFFLDQKLGKHVIFQVDKFGLQLLRSSHAYQIGSLQIYQNDWYRTSCKSISNELNIQMVKS